MAETKAREAERHASERPRSKQRAKLTPTEARQGEIVLGRFGRVLWIAVLAVLIVGVAIFSFWGLA